MKKITSIIAVGMTALGLAACGTTSPTKQPAQTTQAIPTSNPDPAKDSGTITIVCSQVATIGIKDARDLFIQDSDVPNATQTFNAILAQCNK